jgi:hypothetical protein
MCGLLDRAPVSRADDRGHAGGRVFDAVSRQLEPQRELAVVVDVAAGESVTSRE